jgi:hypothetical protein
MIRIDSEVETFKRMHSEAVAAAETYRKFYRIERDEYVKLQKELAMRESELSFIAEQLGAKAWSALADKYDALQAAAVRKVTGYAYTKGEHAQ